MSKSRHLRTQPPYLQRSPFGSSLTISLLLIAIAYLKLEMPSEGRNNFQPELPSTKAGR